MRPCPCGLLLWRSTGPPTLPPTLPALPIPPPMRSVAAAARPGGLLKQPGPLLAAASGHAAARPGAGAVPCSCPSRCPLSRLGACLPRSLLPAGCGMYCRAQCFLQGVGCTAAHGRHSSGLLLGPRACRRRACGSPRRRLGEAAPDPFPTCRRWCPATRSCHLSRTRAPATLPLPRWCCPCLSCCPTRLCCR